MYVPLLAKRLDRCDISKCRGSWFELPFSEGGEQELVPPRRAFPDHMPPQLKHWNIIIRSYMMRKWYAYIFSASSNVIYQWYDANLIYESPTSAGNGLSSGLTWIEVQWAIPIWNLWTCHFPLTDRVISFLATS